MAISKINPSFLVLRIIVKIIATRTRLKISPAVAMTIIVASKPGLL
jgi:hypothetical protein